MNPVSDIKEKDEARKRVKDFNNGKVVTNFYDFSVDRDFLFFPGSLIHEKVGNSEMFLYKDIRSFRLFYYSTSLEQLEFDLKKLSLPSNFSVILEITERIEVSPLNVEPNFCLVKMSKKSDSLINKVLSDYKITDAVSQDLYNIENILLSNFDPILERIPGISELAKILNKHGIKVFKIGNEIKGLIIFNEDTNKLHLRYIWVDPNLRNQGIASLLMNEFFRYANSNNINTNFLWVGVNNIGAQMFYNKLGFKKECLFDFIYFL